MVFQFLGKDSQVRYVQYRLINFYTNTEESGMLSTEDQKHPWMMQRLSDDKRPNN